MVWPPAGGIGNPHGNPAFGRMIDHFEEELPVYARMVCLP
jgi:hypothetical protein